MQQLTEDTIQGLGGTSKRSRWVTNAVVGIAALMFVLMGGQVVPQALGLLGPGRAISPGLHVAFVLNVALLLFAWRRSADLRRASEAREVAERRAQELACKDDTTGLFNRKFLIERMNAFCGKGTGLTLLLLDLDHFKKVNDLYGHAIGDELLVEVARRIKATSPEDACWARLGGDEFAILIHGAAARKEHATGIAEALLSELSKPIKLDSTVAMTSASIGLSSCEDGCNQPTSLLHRSDIAMYHAKALGRNCLAWFDEQMEEEVNRRNRIEAEVREGLTSGQFVPYFQPMIDLASGEIKGFEVLARWNHPTRGVVEPNEFILIAEATGLISELSTKVMRDALRIARSWPNHLTLAINVSPVQFKDPLLDQRIIKVLAETGFPANRLEIELTESSLLEDQMRALSTVESLKNQGVRISLDDFGTGYASLSQLRTLPFDRIKIDKSFVASLLDDPQSNAIVHAIATLGNNLNLPITAEGVETEVIHKRLQELGCADAQGWLFGKAASAEDTARLFAGQSDVPETKELPESDIPETWHPKERRDFTRRASNG